MSDNTSSNQADYFLVPRQGDVADFIAYRAQVNSKRTACIDMQSGQSFSYGELNSQVSQCASWLTQQLSSGARVAMLSRNRVEFLIVFFACVRARMIFLPLNWRLSGAELRALVADGTPDIFIYESEFEESAREALQGHSILQVLHITSEQNPLLDAFAEAESLPATTLSPDAPVLLLFTSGTTGKPKGVVITVQNTWTASNNFCFAFEVGIGDVLLCDMPLFHVAGLGMASSALYQGSTVLISDRFVPAVALQRISNPALQITHYFAVTQMVIAMMQEPGFAAADFSRLKAITVGGSPLPKSLVEHYLQRNVTMINTYGISEAMGTVLAMPLDREIIASRTESCGKPAILIDVRLVGEDGKDVDVDEVGEIWIRGNCITPGYWQQTQVTEQAFSDGWFRTGDAARRNADGYHVIVDRWKDMYISGGENVYPAEVEAVIIEHEAVLEVGVVGVPDERWGEVGCAFVVAVTGQTVDINDIVVHCRQQLAGYKLPKHLRIIEELPRTASGKIRKEVLRGKFLQL